MSKKILIFTSEMLPGLGYSTAGGGIRAWQIGEGLKSKNYGVIYSIPKRITIGRDDLPESIREYAYEENQLMEIVRKAKPDIIVCIQWPHANKLDKLDIPIALDLFGILMLENAYYNQFDFELFTISKLDAFSKADYFICASDKQKAYFFTWMMLSGIDPKSNCVAVIPVSLSPNLPKPTQPDELLLVFGGVFWPWQDPFTPLNRVIKKMEELAKGKLKIFGGAHPYLKDISLTFPDPEISLIKSSRVQRNQIMLHEQLIQEYLSASLAVDLMMPNNERFLAYPIRTVSYLWAGLPVLISDFCDISHLVREYNAGWVVDPTHPNQLENILDEILSKPVIFMDYKLRAQKLVREQLTWDKTIEPLARYCENPVKLDKRQNMFNQTSGSLLAAYQKLGSMGKDIEKLVEEIQLTQKNYYQVKADLDAIRNKKLYKLYHNLKHLIKK